MSGLTTGRLQLPYPTLTDTPDIPRDITALAAKLDPEKGTNGINAGGIMPIDSTSVNQFTVDGGTKNWTMSAIRLSKVMNQCAITLHMARAAGAATITGGTNGAVTDNKLGVLVPIDLYPESYVSGIFDGSTAFGYVQLDSAGLVLLRGFSTAGMTIKAGDSLRVTLAYPAR